MNLPIKNTNQTSKLLTSANGDQHSLLINLEQQRAARWLVCIEELIPICQAIELELFLEELSDASWLARWKREDVLVKFDPLLLPALVSALASETACIKCRACVIEDIIETLSRCRG